MYALNWLEAPKINTCSLNEKCDNNGLDLGILKSITLYTQARPISKPDNTHTWKNEQSLFQTSNFCHCTIFPFFRALWAMHSHRHSTSTTYITYTSRAKWWEYKKTNKVQLAFGSGTASGDYDKNIRIPGTCHWLSKHEGFWQKWNEIKNHNDGDSIYIVFKCYTVILPTLIASFCSQL